MAMFLSLHASKGSISQALEIFISGLHDIWIAWTEEDRTTASY